MRRAPWLAIVIASASCAAFAQAPIDYRHGAGAPLPPPAQTRPPATPQPSRAPDWSSGPGPPLSTWALQPDEAAPFDPAHRPRTHTVVAGDTLYALSVRYQIPLRPLIDANRLDAPFALAVGDVLRLPPPLTVRAGRGDTLVSLARRYNIDARSLALLNRLPKPYAVRAGDTLVLPALAREDAAPPPMAQEPRAPAPSRSAQSAPQPSPDPAPTTGPARFAWPVMGAILTRFGPQQGGRRSDGVDIAAAEGADVKAAADGRVVYAGEDLAGYGHLMLVQHSDGWVTAYAHCSAFAVKEGDRVRRGQKLGLVGKTATGETKLHFQVRKGGAPTDPLAVLPPV